MHWSNGSDPLPVMYITVAKISLCQDREKDKATIFVKFKEYIKREYSYDYSEEILISIYRCNLNRFNISHPQLSTRIRIETLIITIDNAVTKSITFQRSSKFHGAIWIATLIVAGKPAWTYTQIACLVFWWRLRAFVEAFAWWRISFITNPFTTRMLRLASFLATFITCSQIFRAQVALNHVIKM